MTEIEVAATFWLSDRHGPMFLAPVFGDVPISIRSEGRTFSLLMLESRGSIAAEDEPSVVRGLGFTKCRVAHRLRLPVPAESLGESLSSAAMDLVEHESMEVVEAAAEALRRFREWARIDHPWLAHPFGEPEQVERGEVLVVETGRVLPFAPELRRPRGFLLVGEEPLSGDDVAEIVSKLEADFEPSPAEQLLADARYLMHWAPVKDPARAVLVSAIATEVKAKTVLRERAKPDAAAVLSVLLDNSRAFPHAANELLNQVAEAVLGRSLRNENKPLANKVQALFELRNRIAHRGERPSKDEASDAVAAAIEAWNWLESL